MTVQTLITALAAGLAALYFIHGAVQDLRGGSRPADSACGTCSSGGCPVAKAGRTAG